MFSYTSEAKKESFNSIDLENLLEWVHHPNSAINLAVVQILGEQLARTTCLHRGQNHGVPQRKLPADLKRRSETENGQRVVDDRPMRKIRNQSGGFLSGMPVAHEIDVEFLKHLHAHRRPPRLKPCLLNQGSGD
jgi:hypothetical protein